MIQHLKALVLWLESRFPEKVIVTAEAYARGAESLDRVIEQASALNARLATVETNSVHKDAVKDLIAVVTALKNDVDALKANLGWGKTVEKAEELRAMLNGEVL